MKSINCLSFVLIFLLDSCNSWSKPKITLDEFFNNTEFLSLTLAPNNDPWILIQTIYPRWDQNIFEYHLHLQSLNGTSKKLITRHTTDSLRPLWQDDWIAYSFEDQSKKVDVEEQQHFIQLYSTRTQQIFSLALGKEPIHAFTWSNKNTSLYFATQTSWSKESETEYKNEWNDAIEYREKERGDTIFRVNFEDFAQIRIDAVTNISLQVAELLCSPDGKTLVFSTVSRSRQIESINDYEIYSFDLTNHLSSSPVQLTNNQAIERNLKWFNDDSILFTVIAEGSIEGEYHDTQGRLYSISLVNGRIHRWADQFTGSVTGFALLDYGHRGVIILGQLNTEIQIYTQLSPTSPLIKRIGWNGTYEKLVTSSTDNVSMIAFIHSSFDTPQEVYFVDIIEHLSVANIVTNENIIFTKRNLPKGTSYQWMNEEDGTEIEGVLLYPPDKFGQKNLPLLVLIHGGPYSASLNAFRADWYNCAMMLATEGWLVLQPNYRGSTGLCYGDQFLHDVIHEFLSRPGKDILFGVDALIKDGIADPKKLAIDGYSYGGYLTNWLITQTTRFNVALTGAGGVENVVDWGTNDMPLSNFYFLGGFPWQIPSRYQEQAAIFQLDKVRTPTHIITGGNDIRVPVAHNYLFERALRSLDIPHKLIIFPNEGHDIGINPWHGKIKIREELKWLHKYGFICVWTCEETLISLGNS
ncbi:unnamed protein product [Rotaria magnacalcarata]